MHEGEKKLKLLREVKMEERHNKSADVGLDDVRGKKKLSPFGSHLAIWHVWVDDTDSWG